MHLYEYQAKKILQDNGIKVLPGIVVSCAEDALLAAQKLQGSLWAIKAQIFAGGRGKAGGIKIATNLAEVSQFTNQLMGQTLITEQTDASGEVISKIYIEHGARIIKEFYISFVIDRESCSIKLVASISGGVNIESNAHDRSKVLILNIDPWTGLQPYHLRQITALYQLTGIPALNAEHIINDLYKVFIQYDLTLLEINPLALLEDYQIVALDAKISIDDNAMYRQAKRLHDHGIASEICDSNYITLDGDIGCLVNGAGLAMATMDMIKNHGGNPANFLDIGGGATSSQVISALQIMLSNSNIKCILINIFGGIMRCDIIAQGIIDAVKALNIQIPIVVRLAGTSVEEGKNLLKSATIPVHIFENMDEAAHFAIRIKG